MKLAIKKSEAKVTGEHGISKFSEYELPFNKLSTGVSEINGRYPEKGFDMDTEIEATWYVVSGTGEIYLGEQIYKVEEGYVVLVPRSEKFWINGKNLKLVVASSPPWYPEQHKHIEG